MNQKKYSKLPQSAYQIYQLHRKQAHYPYCMVRFLQKSPSQFQKNRIIRMLSDWLIDYQGMNQITKQKFITFIPKILKVFHHLFMEEKDISYCLSKFWVEFYLNWNQFTYAINQKLNKSSIYTLKFLWYIAFDFCQKLDPEKQYQLNLFMAQNFQSSLRKYQNQDDMTYKPLLQTIRMINIQSPKKQFVQNSVQWSQKMIGMYQKCQAQKIKMQVLIQIVGCRSFLYENKQTQQFWLSTINSLVSILEVKLPKLLLTHQTDVKLLQCLLLLTCYQPVQTFLISQKKRLLPLLQHMKIHPSPQSPFHYQKYYSLRQKMINLFFNKSSQQSLKEMDDILTQFNRKYLSVLKDNEENLMFFDCMCQTKRKLSRSNIIEVIKALTNSHSRKNFPVNVLIILVKVLHCVIQMDLPEELVCSVIKSLTQCIASKINDPRIAQLRIQISKYYISLGQKYLWGDQKTTQIMLIWCEQFQRNNKMASTQTISLLRILTKKQSNVVFTTFVHKLQGLISDIVLKLKFNKFYFNIPCLTSLLISLFLNIHWKQSHKFLLQICSQNPNDLTFVYLLQSQIITKQTLIEENNPEQFEKVFRKEVEQLRFIMGEREIWVKGEKNQQLNVFLMYTHLYLTRLNKQQAVAAVFQLDQLLLTLFQQLYEYANYHLMIHIAARIFFAAKTMKNLLQMKSYLYFKEISFDMLSRSFHKKTILLISYMYSTVLTCFQNFQQTFIQLNKGRFLDSLFKGCDDFMGKTNIFYQQICSIILFFIQSKQTSLCQSFCGNLKQVQKNRKWWQQIKYRVSFRLPIEAKIIVDDKKKRKQQNVLIEEFRQYYEDQIKKYFQAETNNRHLKYLIQIKDNKGEEVDQM